MHEGSKVERAAVVSDARGGEYFDGAGERDRRAATRPACAAPRAVPRGRRADAAHPLQGDAPAPPAGAAAAAWPTASRPSASCSRRCASAPTSCIDTTGLSAAALRRKVADELLEPEQRPAGSRCTFTLVRPQARPAARRRPRLRRALPAQPALRGRAAPADRLRPADRRLRRPRRRAGGVLRPRCSRCSSTCCPQYVPRARRTWWSRSAAPAAATARWRSPSTWRSASATPTSYFVEVAAPRRRPGAPDARLRRALDSLTRPRTHSRKGSRPCPYAWGSTASAASAATSSAPRTERDADIEWVAVNDITDAATLAHLLKYDSIYGPFPGTVEHARRRASSSTASEIKVLAERDPADAAVGRPRRRRRDRVDRPLHQARRRRQAPRGRAPRRSSSPPRPTEPGRHRRARRQLRRGLRPEQAPRHLQRVVHDELPRAGGQGAARRDRHRARPDDDDPRLHGRPAPAGHAAQGPAPRPRGRDQPDPGLDRRRQGDRPRDPRARRASSHGFAVRAPVPTGSVVDLTVDGRRATRRGGGQRGVRGRRRHGPLRGHPRSTPRTRSSPSDIVKTRTRRSSTPS